MNKVNYIIFLLLILFLGSSNVFAKEINYEGSTGVYVKKEIGSNYESSNIRKYTKYGTKNYLYSIDPFLKNTFNDTYRIEKINSKLVDDRVKMIAYVGDKLFNEKNDATYYGVAQVMIWDLLKDEGNITFNEEDKYGDIIKEINNEVEKMLSVPFKNEYKLDIGSELVFDISSYEIIALNTDIIEYKVVDNKLIIKGLKNGKATINLKKYFNDKNYDMEVFKNDTYTDYISAGNFYLECSFSINVVGGVIKLNINGEDNYNVSYGIFDNKDNMVFKIDCNKNGSFLSNNLVYGKYKVKLLNINEGYKVDKELYEINLNNEVIDLDLNIRRDKYKVNINFRNSEGEIIKDVIEYKINDTYIANDGTSIIWLDDGIYELVINNIEYTLCDDISFEVSKDIVLDIYLLDKEEVAIEVPDTFSFNYIYILLGIVYVKKFIFY